jgi:hypothetical protein
MAGVSVVIISLSRHCLLIRMNFLLNCATSLAY